ncbi:hypothetical protein BGZ76_010973 [Entomortierella beljakovae]|nr:hypothetical protein BGZ76_010973 [Entomortierella beljakovae]
MSSRQKKKTSPRNKSSSPSPSDSPPMPPAPSMAHNKGSASPRHMQSESESAALRSRSKRDPSQRLSAAANADTDDLSRSAVPVPGLMKGSVRRLFIRFLILYLGYAIFFVCPEQSTKDAVCKGVSKFQDWLRPHAQPVYEKLDETYRSYGEPYYDQYGRPLQKQCQKYYTEVAEPAIKSASEKVTTSYNQYAHPHVVKVADVIYTDDVKNRLNRAQKTLLVYRNHANEYSEQAKNSLHQKFSHASDLYDEHVQPMVTKASPHVKAYWKRASLEAGKAFNQCSIFYMKHVNPYAQHTFAVVMDAALNAKESFAWHTDEIWGTKFSKRNQSKFGQAAEKVSKVADQAKHKVEEPVAKVVEDAQKVVVDGAEHLKKLAEEKIKEASKVSEQIKKTVVQKAQDAEEAIVQKASNIRDAVQGAGANIVDDVVGASNVVKETVEKQAENVAEVVQDTKKLAQDQAQHAQQAFDAAAHQASQKAQAAKKTVKDTRDKVQEQAEIVIGSAEQIVMGGEERIDQKVENAKETIKHKVYENSAASKAALAAMLANIETAFEKFYEYEGTETKNLWSNLESVIDDHISTAKESAEELEKSNREAYETFKSYVQDWHNQEGTLEDKLAQLHHHSVESIKKIGLKAMDEQRAAHSKAQVLSNNIEVYLSGLTGFLEDRLTASKETVDSDLSVFKDTSSKIDGKILTDKIQELELAARSRLEKAGKDAHGKVQELLNQANEVWTQSESKSHDYLQLTRGLAKTAREKAKAAFQNDPNIRVATEEPGSGHRRYHF